MNKRLIVVGILVVLALAAGGYFMFANKTSSQPTPSSITTQDNNPQATSDNSQQASLKELLTSGKSEECTFSDNTEGVNVSGTVYVANAKMRGDFDSQANGQTIKSHMLIDGQTLYIWTDGQTQGFKMSLDAIPSPNASTKTQGNVDVNKKINYSCNNWTTDNSKFTLPIDVKFQDFSSLVPTVSTKPGATESSNSTQCAACNSLSGDAKLQCLKALSCN